MFEDYYKVSIGLDLSLSRTGVSLFWTDNEEAKTMCIKSPQKGMKRLLDLEQKLTQILLPFKETALVVIEDYAFGGRGSNLFGLIEWGGIARMATFKLDINAITISPKSLKKFATGNGNAKKEDVMAAITEKWGYVASTNDEADAYALSRIGDSIIHPSRYTQEQLAASQKFKPL
jgi:crossover junction endodeoxyribonuclease RuvC